MVRRRVVRVGKSLNVWAWPTPAATSGQVPLHSVNTLCHRKRSATNFAKTTTVSNKGWNLVCAFTHFFGGNTLGLSQISGAIGGLLSTTFFLKSLRTRIVPAAMTRFRTSMRSVLSAHSKSRKYDLEDREDILLDSFKIFFGVGC